MGLFKPNIANLQAKHDIDGLSKALRSNDLSIQKNAIWALVALGDREAVSALELFFMKDCPSYQLETVMYGFEKLKWQPSEHKAGMYYWIVKKDWGQIRAQGKRAVPALIWSLDKSIAIDDTPRRILIEIGEPAVEPLITCLTHNRIQVRQDAAYCLGLIGDKRAVIPLTTLLKNPSTASSAIEALGRLGDPQVLDAIILVVKDQKQDRNTRQSAVIALGNLGDTRAAPVIIDQLNDNWSNMRYSAAEALGRLRDPRANAMLQAVALKDDNPGVARAASEALYLIASGDKRSKSERALDTLTNHPEDQ